MINYICATCGTQFSALEAPPNYCSICEDERQYIGADGQQWTTLEALRAGHRNTVRAYEPNLVGIGTEPKFAIGQRTLLIQRPQGNILWDCVSLIDDSTVETINKLGGVSAIAFSHPHMYASMVEWAHAFDAPIYIHAKDREHVMRPDPTICYWEGETHLLGDGITLINTGGHFAGSSVLHWAQGAEGRGVLLAGDTVYVVQDRRYVSFMYSYPNLIPLPAKAVRRIVEALEPYSFERIYSAWWDSITLSNGKEAVRASAKRYINAIEGTPWT